MLIPSLDFFFFVHLSPLPQHTLLTHLIDTPHQHTLSTHPINTPPTPPTNTPYQHTLSTLPLNPLYQHAFSIHPTNTPYPHTLSTLPPIHSINTSSQSTLSTHPKYLIHTLLQHIISHTSSTHPHNSRTPSAGYTRGGGSGGGRGEHSNSQSGMIAVGTAPKHLSMDDELRHR